MSNQLQNVLNEIKLEKDTNLLPENIKKDVKIFDIVGTLEEGGTSKDVPVKLFKTQEEMQADTNAKEGDLAVVYRSEVQNATVDSEFQTATFPDTVVLDNAITDYVEVRYRAVDSSKMFDCWGSLDSSMFRMDCYTETGSIRIQYTSEDGITYTRTDSTGNPVDFGTEIYYEMPDYWNDAIGYFIQAGGNTFEGLFQFKTNYTEQNIYKNANYLDDQPNYYNIDERLLALRKYGRTFIIPNVVENRGEYLDIVSGTLYTSTSSEYKIVKQPSRTLLCLGAWDSDTDSTVIFTKIDFDLSLDNIIVSKTSILKADLNNYPYKFSINNYMCTWYSDMILTDQIIVNIDLDVLKVITTVDDAQPSSAISGEIVYYRVENLIHNSYKYAPTQLTLSEASQLLPGKIAYGRTNVIEGDGSIYNNLDAELVFTNIFNFDKFYVENENNPYYGQLSHAHTNTLDNNKLYNFKYSTNDITDYSIGMCDDILLEKVKNIIRTDSDFTGENVTVYDGCISSDKKFYYARINPGNGNIGTLINLETKEVLYKFDMGTTGGYACDFVGDVLWISNTRDYGIILDYIDCTNPTLERINALTKTSSGKYYLTTQYVRAFDDRFIFTAFSDRNYTDKTAWTSVNIFELQNNQLVLVANEDVSYTSCSSSSMGNVYCTDDNMYYEWSWSDSTGNNLKYTSKVFNKSTKNITLVQEARSKAIFRNGRFNTETTNTTYCYETDNYIYYNMQSIMYRTDKTGTTDWSVFGEGYGWFMNCNGQIFGYNSDMDTNTTTVNLLRLNGDKSPIVIKSTVIPLQILEKRLAYMGATAYVSLGKMINLHWDNTLTFELESEALSMEVYPLELSTSAECDISTINTAISPSNPASNDVVFPNYTCTISPIEYNTAVNTTNEILGEEV